MRGPDDTIVAVATAPAEGGIGIVRLSGGAAPAIASRLFSSRSGRPLLSHPPFRLVLGLVRSPDDGEPIDEVLAVHMPRGRSYTTEPMVEIQAHGGPFLLARIVEAACSCGARVALPGEFTQRAFLNGRLDLAQAEAVAELVRASSDIARRHALRRLRGELSREIAALRGQHLAVAAQVEAALDFEEEEGLSCGLDFTELERLRAHVEDLIGRGEARRGAREGCHAVLAGRTNAGKSSLFNVLLNSKRSIVSPLPGTTRDFVEDRAHLGGVSFTLVDTAGIGETRCAIEAEGIRRARKQAEGADVLLWVLDASRALDREATDLLQVCRGRRAIVALTKVDLPRQVGADEVRAILAGPEVCEVSSMTGAGIPALREALARHCRRTLSEGAAVGGIPPGSRHLEILRRYLSRIECALRGCANGDPLDAVAAELRVGLDILAELTGESAAEEVLELVFSRFCVGK